MQKIRYLWQEFEDDCDILFRRIRRTYKPSTIIALARGGLCLGVKLSHKIKKPLMIVSCKTYNDQKQTTNTVLLNSSYTVPLQSPVLILDEIADSGKTLRIVKEHFESLGVEVKVATLLYKPHSIVKPDWYVKEVKNDDWIEFPWEA